MLEKLSKINAQEMPVMVGETLESVVLKLEKFRKEGKNYFAIFNDQVLYSEDITMDSAFKKCLNMSRQMYLYRYKQWLLLNNLTEESIKTYVTNNLDKWINKGKKYVINSRYEDFELVCKNLANNIYSYMVIEQFIKIMELINNNFYFNDVLDIIDSFNNNELNNNILFDLILNYTYIGPDFYTYAKPINNFEYKYIGFIKKINKRLKLNKDYSKVCKELMRRKINRIIICDNNKNIALEGLILINNNGNFEGIINNEFIVRGSIINSYISIDCYNTISSNIYYGAKLNEEDYFECYDDLDNEWHIYLKDINKDFKDELIIEKNIEDLKKSFENDVNKSKKLVK